MLTIKCNIWDIFSIVFMYRTGQSKALCSKITNNLFWKKQIYYKCRVYDISHKYICNSRIQEKSILNRLLPAPLSLDLVKSFMLSLAKITKLINIANSYIAVLGTRQQYSCFSPGKGTAILLLSVLSVFYIEG